MLKLYYFVDPMCSWCYGFSSEMKEIVKNLPDNIRLQYIMGGLAPDSDEPMLEEMKGYIKHHWQTVAARTGAEFNFDFWTKGEPKRATYPSCRAVIAAGLPGEANISLMLGAIQKAYYQQARNPSDNETLVEIAGEMGLDKGRFSEDLNSPKVEELLQTDFEFKYRLGVQGFPTLALEKDGEYFGLTVGYAKADVVLQRLDMVLNDKTGEKV
ncbi:DsbA family protein [Chloroflexota bacterium]